LFFFRRNEENKLCTLVERVEKQQSSVSTPIEEDSHRGGIAVDAVQCTPTGYTVFRGITPQYEARTRHYTAVHGSKQQYGSTSQYMAVQGKVTTC